MSFVKKVMHQKNGLIEKAWQTICEHNMLDCNSSVLLGVSGGPDSMALLHVLIGLKGKGDYRLGIAHVNHGVRGDESDCDAAFVESLAKKQNLPYYEKKIDLEAIREKTGNCLEEAGRDARYAFFHETADRYGFDKIAVGHHLEDDAELILMNIIRGSGPAGTAGIAPVRDRIVRPLIHCRRSDILIFLKSENIAYVYDKTNDNTRFQRNHVRHRLIPALEQYNPRVVENLHRLGQISGTENQWIDLLITPVFDAAVRHREERRMVEMDAGRLADHHIAVKRRIVRKAVFEVKGDLRRISFKHIDAVIDLLEKGRPTRQIDIPGRIRVTRSGKTLVFKAESGGVRPFDPAESPSEPGFFEYAVPEAEAVSGRIQIPETGARIVLTRLPVEEMATFPSGKAAVFDWDSIGFPLYIRNMRPGDRFVPLGMSGSQKIKDFFINNKVSRQKRGQVLILTSGRDVVWIAGFRIDDRFKITRKTKTVLKAELTAF